MVNWNKGTWTVWRGNVYLLVLCFLLLAGCNLGPFASRPTATPEPPTATPEPPTPELTPTPESGAVQSLDDVVTAVVQIEAQGTFVDPGEGTVFNAAGSGSGFIIDESGLAVTNNHVVTGAALLKVYVGGDNEPRNARVLGASECSDLAVIDIEGDGYPYLEWYDDEIKVRLDVFAAGFPLADEVPSEYTLTRGIVSKARTSGETSWSSVDNVLEHDATINPGSSGGPLITEDGKVVGINYAGSSDTNQYFAIARDEAVDLIEQLIEGENITSLGINGEAFITSDGESSGIWIYSVKSGSPADNAGIRPGDILTKLERLVLATDGTMNDYCDILRSREPDDTMAIEVVRLDTQELLEGQLNGEPLRPVDAPSGDRTPGSDPAPSPVAAIPGLIAFSSDSDGDRDLYVLDPNTAERVQITNEPGNEVYPAWSPNGCSLAFSYDRGDGTTQIYIIDAPGDAPRPLTDNNASNYKPSWSRDNRIAFHANIDDPGDFDIYVIDSDGGNLRNLTADSTAKEEAPAWSPDGSALAFVSNRSGSDHIYLMNADGSNVTQLTSGSGEYKAPAWSPDGETISFTLNRDGNADIYVIDTDGSKQLTSNPAGDWFATWSPDGAFLAFISLRDSPAWELYGMRANGSEKDIVRLTENSAQDLEPAWSSADCGSGL